MGKILAIIFLVAFVYYAGPIIRQGIWYSPTLYPEYWWGPDVYNYEPDIARDGGGWFGFNPLKSGFSGRTTASIIDSL